MEIAEKYLIDSDILVDYLRGSDWARNFLFELKEKGILAISVINVVEIYSGKEIRDEKKREIINGFLGEFEIIPLKESLAKKAGEVRMEYQIPFADAIIAATAIENRLFLATKNIKHFSKIKGLKLLSPR